MPFGNRTAKKKVHKDRSIYMTDTVYESSMHLICSQTSFRMQKQQCSPSVYRETVRKYRSGYMIVTVHGVFIIII